MSVRFISYTKDKIRTVRKISGLLLTLDRILKLATAILFHIISNVVEKSLLTEPKYRSENGKFGGAIGNNRS
jgi:hypothetical protein